jgi:hypothetical protein
MVRCLSHIGENGENKLEFAALSTDTLPTEWNGRALAEGSIAKIYDASDTTKPPTYKQLLDVEDTGVEWYPV